MEKRHRIFVAINLPDDVKRELASYAKKCPELPAKWVARDNLHITLEFLGALTEEEMGEVCLATKDVAKRHSSFSLNINQILYGPEKLKPNQPPKMVWASGEKLKELSELKNDLQGALLEKIRFRPEERVFKPHITLARIGAFAWRQIEPEEMPEVNENIDLLFTVESIEVMESEMKKDGPIYTVLESHNLR